MSKPLQRTIHPEVRIISESEGLVDYIASDETPDCYDEVIAAKGWRFTRFAKNAPFVDSHEYCSIASQLGIVTSFQVRNKQLVERVKWAKDVQENSLAQLGWKMTLGGFLKAVSVGFFPVRSVCMGDADWGKTIAAMNIPADVAPNICRIFLEQEQIELSACIIGANPNALAKAHKDGCVKDADLAACGFADDDMEFLHAASKAMEDPNATELTRLMIGREMRRLTRPQDFKEVKSSASATSASKPDGAEQAKRLAADRKSFLESLSRIVG
jgi:hypothetical protein